MPEQATVNVLTQLFPEVTPGTAGAATHQLAGMILQDKPKLNTTQYTQQGHLYLAESVPGKEWVEFQAAGYPDFNGLAYPFSSLWGAATITTPANASAARQWQWKPGIVNAALGQTFTVERGTSAVRARRYPFCFFDGFGLQIVKDAVTISSSHVFGQNISDNFTLTAAVPVVPAIPLNGPGASIFLDTTSAGIGVTQLKKVGQNQVDWSNYFGPVYFVDQTQASFSAVAPMQPSVILKIKAVTDANGMAMYPYIKSGQTVYARYKITGPAADNQYILNENGASGGTFTLTYNGQVTAAQAQTVTAANLATALTGLSTVGAGNATVTGSAGGPYTIYLLGPLLVSSNLLTLQSSLTGGTGATLVQTIVNYSLTMDFACKVTAPGDYADDQKLEVMEYTLMAAEDPAWNSGQAMLITLVNTITAL